jgi:hypothetical protein
MKVLAGMAGRLSALVNSSEFEMNDRRISRDLIANNLSDYSMAQRTSTPKDGEHKRIEEYAEKPSPLPNIESIIEAFERTWLCE